MRLLGEYGTSEVCPLENPRLKTRKILPCPERGAGAFAHVNFQTICPPPPPGP